MESWSRGPALDRTPDGTGHPHQASQHIVCLVLAIWNWARILFCFLPTSGKFTFFKILPASSPSSLLSSSESSPPGCKY
eukprot:s157_g14.t1